VVESRHNRNQLNIRGNKHTSNATNDFWMQQAHQLSQQSLHSTQQNFIVAIGMHYHNQLNTCGNKHISIATLNRYYRNAQSVVAIATHKGSNHFHRGINTNLLQRLFQ
jgi:hypothetical protein